ncbi:hypothetical protein CHLNCDRAFT_136287 [Chlorella variabilis]|uniref:Uncharacterized protein n=1 Tax=Chlorella variabilis TaxID=554065 RepID=E1ZK16_CHLVA|nr:hypothetical protein CHLNCDRAFT_136287 [Chlorella variabilis]EFN53617.1 hypothetical protein CHLNCDRAFT_136287 [Chlorella variabilis]|eukprot:XP_005845719.1 hypothetical protein CHLNCDRAFT_136287 [Chlorella variabilis]
MSLAAGGLGRWRGGRKLKGDLLTAGGGVMPDPLQMAAAAAERRSLVEDAATAQDPAFDFSAPVAEPVPVRALTAVGAELPVPQVDPATLPPLTNVLGPLEADLLVEDYFISWLPTNSSSGELCQMTSAGELPEAFLLGDFQDLVGYEEDCTPETLPEVGGGELVAF